MAAVIMKGIYLKRQENILPADSEQTWHHSELCLNTYLGELLWKLGADFVLKGIVEHILRLSPGIIDFIDI